MELRYALYERTHSGYCWTWRAAGLLDALLDDFRYRVAVPNDSNAINAENLRGGICKFDRIVDSLVEEHVVLYRFFDGGTDAGRPNRVVMLTAWTTPRQVTEMPGRYGVAAVFRNAVFEYVSSNARTVGIDQPPFCDSLTAEEECSRGGPRRMPSAALMEFIDEGLPDKDSTCYLTIADNEYSLQRKPSAACERREKERQSHEQQRLAAERERDKEKAASRNTDGMEWERQVADGNGSIGSVRRRETKGAGLLAKGIILLTALSLCTLIAAGAMRYGNRLGWGGVTLSAEAKRVLSIFQGLSPDEQRRVLAQLEELCEQRQRQDGPQVAPTNRGAVSHSQRPAVSPSTQNTPSGSGPDATGFSDGDPSVAPGGSSKQLGR